MKTKLHGTILCMFLLIPLVVGECTGDKDDDKGSNRSEARKYQIIAIICIFLASAIGVTVPMLGKFFPRLKPEKNLFFIVKAFAAGVILATGFIHILPDAFKNLTSQCLDKHPWGKFPFAGFAAMLSAIAILMVDTISTSHYTKCGNANSVLIDYHHHHQAGNSTDGNLPGPNLTELLRHRVITQVFELGIVVHSVIIGITVGVSQKPDEIRPLVAALCFHQCFEGMGLGGCIAQAKFKSREAVIMGIIFSLTTPTGIAVGMIIASTYDENSPKALIVQGLLDAASAGILIYMSLVDLLAADFMSTKVQNKRELQLWGFVSLLIGAGCMSTLAIWA